MATESLFLCLYFFAFQAQPRGPLNLSFIVVCAEESRMKCSLDRKSSDGVKTVIESSDCQ